MAMLQHGFVDENAQPTFKPDETDPMAYGIVKLRGRPLSKAAVIVGVIVGIALIVIALFT
jgi:hypothetical protein